MKMTNIDNEKDGDGGGTKINNFPSSTQNQINPSIIKILSSSNSSSPIPMIKSNSVTSVTSATTTSSLISSTVARSQIINNAESEINAKRESNDISNANQIKFDGTFDITSGINKATQLNNQSPKFTSRSNSTSSLNEYYSSSPIPTPKPKSIKSNTILLPSYTFNNMESSTNSFNPFEESMNDYDYYYTEEELNSYKNITNFICKIAQLILRSRVGLSYNHNFYPLLNKKNHDNDGGINSIPTTQMNSLTSSMNNLNIKATYASSISSTDSQPQSIPYSMSINSSYTSSFENSYRQNPNGIINSLNSYTKPNELYIPTPSIDNIKQLHGLLLDRLQFWKNCIPINIDIFASTNGSNPSSVNSYNKMGNENCRRRSRDFSLGMDAERDHDGLYERNNTDANNYSGSSMSNSYNNNTSVSSRVRSSSISNIYPPKPTISSNTTSPTTPKFNNKRLLERWVVSYEPTNDQKSMNLNKGRNSKVDTTDLILLVQSLYSYIRLMPLHSLLSDNSIQKTDLQYCISTADGYLLLPLFEGEHNDVEFCDVGSSGFDLSAKLKVYKFTKASTSLGNLHISVVYDANINNNNPSNYPSLSKSMTSTPTSSISSSYHFNDIAYNTKIASGATSASTIKVKNNVNNNMSSSTSFNNQFKDQSLLTDELSNQTTSTSYSISKNEEAIDNNKSDKKSDTPTNDEPSSPIQKRKTVKTIGSPFPSPKTHTKVLSLTQSKYSFQPKNSQLSSSSPNLIQHLMNKQRIEKYSSSIHSLTDNNTLSSHSNLLLSGFNYKKFSSNDNSMNNQHLSPINIPKNSLTPKLNSKYLNHPQSLSYQSFKYNNDSQGNSMELFGSLVGSYEESILSGRMSTLPSKPIKFISEIGVIGFGKCHPRLKCPPHINISFPVYFYEIPDQNDFFTTPYVGTVDIEQYLQKQNLLKQQKQQLQKQQEQQRLKDEPEEMININSNSSHDHDHSSSVATTKSKLESDDLEDKEAINTSSIPSAILLNDEPIIQRSSSSNSLNGLSSKFPGYRIPFKGQIQVIIKNPSKTAVKVFLIPYDFRDMPPNTKTFIRQKSYLKNTSSSNRNSLDQKYSLRYAIQLQFISPSKKKLYLSKSLRVVFAHKAPEKDEKLYTISDGPVDPKYIPIVDNNSRNYSQASHEYNDDKLFRGHGTSDLNLKIDNKEENSFYSSSYSTRRRSSFGSNAMMLAEMGVNLGDYSVSPVKPMLYQQSHRHSLSAGSNGNGGNTQGLYINSMNPSTSGSSSSSTKVINPLYYGGNTPISTISSNLSSFNPLPKKFDIIHHHPSLANHPSFSKQLPPHPYPQHYQYLSQIINKNGNIIDDEEEEDEEDMSSRLPPKGNLTSYSSGGLTKTVLENHHEPFYPKLTKTLSDSIAAMTTNTSTTTDLISNSKSSIRNLTNETSLTPETNEASTSTLSTDYKVFNYIN